MVDRERIRESQKKRDTLAAFFPRKVSPWLTAWLLRTPATPHQVTIFWGVLSVANTAVVYQALVGYWQLVPVVFLLFLLAFVLDCCDGEVARLRNMSDPIGGKLIDGICHRATEYALLCAYAIAARTLSGHPAAFVVGLALLSGEAMYTFAYERRLTTLRLHLGYEGQLQRSTVTSYERGQRWIDLTPRQRLASLTGLVHYRSLYVMVALAWISGAALMLGLVALAAWKHISWIRLVVRTMDAAQRATRPQAAASDSHVASSTE